MSLLSLFEWLDQTPLAQAIHDSTWAFAASETVHLLFLATLGGAVLLLNLRVLGFGLRTQAPAEVAQQLRPIFWVSLTGVGASGALMMVGEALKCYHHPAFRLKILLLAAALALSLWVQQRVHSAPPQDAPPASLRAAAVLNLALWFSTGVAGRAVGFL